MTTYIAEDATSHLPVDASVVGIPDSEFGQQWKAVVIRKRDATIDESALLDRLRPRIARHPMPSVTEFREELPYTSLGKTDKKSLRGEHPPVGPQ
jgi:acyl-CoA synthetase (AMP-forming)/AMP-acid ligase II